MRLKEGKQGNEDLGKSRSVTMPTVQTLVIISSKLSMIVLVILARHDLESTNNYRTITYSVCSFLSSLRSKASVFQSTCSSLVIYLLCKGGTHIPSSRSQLRQAHRAPPENCPSNKDFSGPLEPAEPAKLECSEWNQPPVESLACSPLPLRIWSAGERGFI